METGLIIGVIVIVFALLSYLEPDATFPLFLVALITTGSIILGPEEETEARDGWLDVNVQVLEEAWEDKEFSEEELNAFSGVDKMMETDVMDVLLDLEQNPDLKTTEHRYESLLKEIRSSASPYAIVSHAWDDERFEDYEWKAIESVDERSSYNLTKMAKSLEEDPTSKVARHLFLTTVEDARRHYEK